eukprot:4945312-Amphidinium_carterae.1
MIQDYSAVRGHSLRPEQEENNPTYSTPAAAPQFLVVEGPPLQGTHAQPVNPMRDGVTTKTVTMQRAMVVRREKLAKHLKSVP